MHIDATVTDSADAPVSGATVELTIVDRTGAEVGESLVAWPVTMSEIGSTGVYRYTTPTDLADDMAVGRYRARVLVTIGISQRYADVLALVAADRD
jgi:hypothetical protein